jgi:hypothetical protein
MHLQVGGSPRETIESPDGRDGVACAHDGQRHTQACIDPCTNNVHACAKLINTGLTAHTGTQMQAQVVTLGFFCAAALIGLSMAQANRDPPVPLTLACERSIGVWPHRRLPCGAASALRDVARQGLDGSADCLCKLHSCTSVRHEVPA